MVQYAYIPREGVVSAPGPTGAWQVNILAGASAWLAFIDETHVPRAADAWVSLFARKIQPVYGSAPHTGFFAPAQGRSLWRSSEKERIQWDLQHCF